MALGIQLLLILFFPALTLWFQAKSTLSKWLSPIVLCYLLGIILRNTGLLPIDNELAQSATEISILIAIPLLLFSTRVRDIRRSAGPALKSFGLCVLAGLISCWIATLIFREQVTDGWKVGGMLVGIYTGGTPNMQAIGLALKAPEETIILLNAADILTGGVYLVMLTSFLPLLLARWMLPYQATVQAEATVVKKEKDVAKGPLFKKILDHAWPFLASLAVVGISVGSSLLLFGNLEQTGFIMLFLTSMSIAASFIPAVQNWQASFPTGEYFLLIFSVALGMMADFQDIIEHGRQIVAFTATAMYLSIGLHFLLARIFRIDRDTFLISSTAALYGPAFVGQIASVLQNRQIVFAGMTLGLLGYAIGNYLGIGLANLLRVVLF